MAKKDKGYDLLWEGVGEKDFINESDNLIDEDLASFDIDAMTFFSQNVNLLRHLPRLADSLKPVERRGLCALYETKTLPDVKQKKSYRI